MSDNIEKETDEQKISTDLELKAPSVKVPEVTEEEKLVFFKAFLSDVPFESVEKLFGGKVFVRFKCLTTEETLFIYDQLRKEQIAEKHSNDTSYLTALATYRLALSLISINDEPLVPKDDDKLKDLENKANYINKWPIYKCSAIFDAFKKFEAKLTVLAEATAQESFWTADSLA